MNHSARCPVCDGTVEINPKPSESHTALPEDSERFRFDGLVICSHCGNAVEWSNRESRSVESDDVDGMSEEVSSPELRLDLKLPTLDGVGWHERLADGATLESVDGDLVDQASLGVSDEASDRMLDLGEESTMCESYSDSPSDIDLDVSDQEHSFDASDKEEDSPIQAARDLETGLMHHPDSAVDPRSRDPLLEEQIAAEMDSAASEETMSGGEEAKESSNCISITESAWPNSGGDDADADASLSARNESVSERSAVPVSPQDRDWASLAKRPRPRTQPKSPLWKLIPPVLGGLTALPLSLGILWYGFGKDIGNMGPTVSRYVPWIVPKQLRGRPYWNSNSDRGSNVMKPTLPSGRVKPNLNAGEFGTIGRSDASSVIPSVPESGLPNAVDESNQVAPSEEVPPGIEFPDEGGSGDECQREPTEAARDSRTEPDAIADTMDDVTSGRIESSSLTGPRLENGPIASSSLNRWAEKSQKKNSSIVSA